MANDCGRVADELVLCLTNITRKGDGKRYGSFRLALKTMWGKQKIDDIASRLDNFRTELVLRILVSMKINDEFQKAREDTRFNNLAETSKATAESILDNQNFFTTGLQDIREAISKNNGVAEARAEKRHAETIAAISTLRHSERSYSWNGHPVPLIDGALNEKALWTLESIQRGVLECLWFRQMSDRREDIAEAHQKTFHWIYQQPRSDQWTDFGKWLAGGNGCYWVNGKAGSGKSTLMKYISENPKTTSLLSSWAADDQILTASFFFWNAGSSLQKSQLGLLRGLLHDAMSQYPSLISIVFPGLCRAIARGVTDIGDPSLSELKEGFSLLISQNVLPLKICFFIDGIDEFERDHYELAQLLKSASSPCVKFIISSRPTSACVEAFSKCSSLQLQDLTEPDILFYVEDKLMDHERMKFLMQNDPVQGTVLILNISVKASGVFLWVIFVVKSLLDGLRNFDRLDDLDRRLSAA